MADKILRQTTGTMSMTPHPVVAKALTPTLPASPPVERAPLPLVAGLLFLSGMCALIFQVSWFREFRLLFGASTAASSAVLAVFMGGLGIGNAVWGKRADRARSPLALYALLELSIALAAAASPLLIGALHGIYIAMGGQLGLGFPAATAVRLAISALVLGVPTFLMGGTLPAAVRAVTVGADRQRRGAALLYGMNTLGAVAGALGSTFFALEFLRHAGNALAGLPGQSGHRTFRAGIGSLRRRALSGRHRVERVHANAAACQESGKNDIARRTRPALPDDVPSLHRLQCGQHRRLRLLSHGARLVPHALPDSWRNHLHLRVDTRGGLDGHRAGRSGLCHVLSARGFRFTVSR